MNQSIVLYSTGCPNCTSLKLLLNKNGFAFTENNSIEEMTGRGFTRVPMLEVDGVVYDFNAAKTWIENNTKGGTE